MNDKYLWTLSIPTDGTPPKFETSSLIEENLGTSSELVQYFGQYLIELGTNILVSLCNAEPERTFELDQNDEELDTNKGFYFE